MRSLIAYIGIIICLIVPVAIHAESATREFVVVIDPGHGGKDYGAIGAISREKDINLAVGKLLGEMIAKEMTDVKIIYTRDNDRFLTLNERAKIANKANGDLFISIHTNSIAKRAKNRKTIAGASTYTLGLHRSDENLEVAKRENSVMVLEPDYSTTYSGFDPNSTESYIIFELNQNKHMEQSIEFAQAVQSEFVATAGRKDKGVKQAGFWVLMATSMPAVLVELDFICNPTQEKFLASESGQKKLATALFNAVKGYKTGYDHQFSPSSANTKKTDNNTGATYYIPTTVEPEPKQDIKENVSTESKSEIIYKVQFLTSSTKLEKGSRKFKKLSPIDYYFDNGVYKYTYGAETSWDKAKKKLQKAKSKFPEAFIIKTRDGKRIE